ncbi:MAG: ABC transporter permease [Patescibacteria group bacterium]
MKDTYISKTLSLSFSLAKTNFKLRNEGSYLGLFWYILNPLALFLIILFIKNEAFRNSDIQTYPAYLLIGLLVFNFFTQTLSAMITLISSYGGLLKSIKVNSEAIIIARVLQSVFSHIFEIILLVVVSLYLGLPFEGIIFYIIGFILFIFFVLGLSFIFATLGLFVTDLSNVWTAVSQALFFISPIFFVLIPGTPLSLLNSYNPLYYFLDFLRILFIEGVLPDFNIVIGVVLLALISFTLGLSVFNRYKSRFAELV